MNHTAANENAWKRGWKDTRTRWTSWVFAIVNLFISISLFLIGLLTLAWYWGIVLAISPFFCIWAYETITAPRKQRNEARKQIILLQEELSKKHSSSVSGLKTKLKGKFFHDFDEEGYVRHQGHIIDFVNDDIVIIQYFEWGLGQPSETKMVWLHDIVDGGWALYKSAEAMRDAYEGFHVKRRPHIV